MLLEESFNAQEAIDAAKAHDTQERVDIQALKNAANARFIDIAVHCIGPPNKKLSNSSQIRFGNKGSICIDLQKYTYFDFETGSGGDIISFIQQLFGYGFGGAIDWLKSYLGDNFAASEIDKSTYRLQLSKGPRSAEYPAERQQRIAYARRIYDRAEFSIRDTVVDSYLRGRGCDLPDQSRIKVLSGVGKFQETGTMVAKLESLETGEFMGVHLTSFHFSHDQGFLTTKNTKRVHGIQKGAVIILKGQSVNGHIAIAEGIETALSIEGQYDCVLSAVNAGNLSKLVFPQHVLSVSIFADNDNAGLTAAQMLQAKCKSKGMACEVFLPPTGFNDFNDHRQTET